MLITEGKSGGGNDGPISRQIYPARSGLQSQRSQIPGKIVLPSSHEVRVSRDFYTCKLCTFYCYCKLWAFYANCKLFTVYNYCKLYVLSFEMMSVTRLGYFLNNSATNLCIKVAQIFRNLLGYFENRQCLYKKPHRLDLGHLMNKFGYFLF